MTKAFQVAGHVFHLSMPDGCGLWRYLTQYDPFGVEAVSEPLFTLDLVQELPEGEPVKVYDAPTEDGQTVIRLYHMGEGWFMEMAQDHNRPDCMHMYTTADFRHARIKLLSRRVSDGMFGINNALMLLYAFCSAPHGTLEMHSSVTVNDGRAYLFLGKSGTGKSTHSSLWLKYIEGSRLLNDDNPVVRIWPDGRVICYGSPWSGKTPCYINEEAPVGAVVRIRQCPENKIARLSIVDAYATLFSSSSGFKTDRKMADALHATMEKFVTTIPFYLLDCRPDEEAAQLCASTVR